MRLRLSAYEPTPLRELAARAAETLARDFAPVEQRVEPVGRPAPTGTPKAARWRKYSADYYRRNKDAILERRASGRAQTAASSWCK